MTRRLPSRPPASWLAAGGAAALLAALAAALLDRSVLAGWLAAFFLIAALPVGGVCLLLMMALIPGTWRGELSAAAFRLALLAPLALAALLPVLLGQPALYGWATATEAGFRGLYLTPWFFVLRSLGFFAFLLLVIALPASARDAKRFAAPAMIAFVLLQGCVAVDWALSLDTRFHSSGFGLYVLSLQGCVALAAAILLRLAARGAASDTALLGKLLLSALLLWAYFAFMQYFIVWSADRPAGVLWYERRVGDGWTSILYGSAVLQLLPTLLLLLLPGARSSPRWLAWIAVAVLLGKTLEGFWLILPGFVSVPVLLTGLAAFTGLSALAGAALMSPRAREWTGRRLPPEATQ